MTVNRGKPSGVIFPNTRRGGTVVESRGSHHDGHQQTQRIDQQMPLPPLDFLAAVVTALLAADLGRLHRLAVDADGTGSRFAAFRGANLAAERIDHVLPGAVVAPLGEVVVDGALGEQVVGEHVPLAARPVEVKDGIDDLPHIHFPRPPPMTAGGNHRFEDRPLSIGQVRRIAFAWRVHVQAPWFGDNKGLHNTQFRWPG